MASRLQDFNCKKPVPPNSTSCKPPAATVAHTVPRQRRRVNSKSAARSYSGSRGVSSTHSCTIIAPSFRKKNKARPPRSALPPRDSKSAGASASVGLERFHCRQRRSGDQHPVAQAQRSIGSAIAAGFASHVRSHWMWAIPLPETLSIADAGPLLCGGSPSSSTPARCTPN